MLRKIFSLIAVILLAAILINGLFSFQIIQSYGDQANREYLDAAAVLAIKRLETGMMTAKVSEEVSATFHYEENPIRLTVIDPRGRVLFDSVADLATLDNHLNRPEVAAARSEAGVGTSIRTSDTTETETLYLARYSRELELVVRTAMPVVTYRTGLRKIATTIMAVFIMVVIILMLLGLSLLRTIIRPLRELEEATSRMQAGDYGVRVPKMLEDDSEVAILARSFNQMAERIQSDMAELEDKNAHLDAILDSMTDPLIAVAKSTAVTFMNSHARSDFGHDIDPEKAVYPLFYVTHDESTDRLVAQAIAQDKPVSEERTLMTIHGPALFTVIASPIRSSRSDGAIITFHDISELRKAQKIRSDFVANVTHELKTPLTSILGFIETLLQGAINKPDVAIRFVDIIDIEA